MTCSCTGEAYLLSHTLSLLIDSCKGFQDWAAEIIYLIQYVSVVAEGKQVKHPRGTRLLMKNCPQALPEVNATFDVIVQHYKTQWILQ